MKCPNCSFDNPEGAVFCNKCGSKLHIGLTVKCKRCNTENPKGSVYCNSCGNKLDEIIEIKEPLTKNKKQYSFIKKIASFLYVGSAIFIVYLFLSFKFPSIVLNEYLYDDCTLYDAYVSDPLKILPVQTTDYKKAQGVALTKTKDNYKKMLLLFGGISITVCIVSSWVKNRQY